MANWTPESLNHATRLRNKLQLAEDAERQRNTSEASQDSPGDAGGSEAGKEDSRSVLRYRVEGKVLSTKNSRQLAKGKSFVNPKAKAWLRSAAFQLRGQHSGSPLTACYHVDLKIYYADGRSHLDLDNASSGLLDALKGVVLKDDAPRYVGRLTVTSQVSRYGQAYCDIELREIQPD